jgi:hypothetical protein
MQVQSVEIAGDNWKLICNTKTWKREKEIFLQHVDTGKYLSSNSRYKFAQVITGINF